MPPFSASTRPFRCRRTSISHHGCVRTRSEIRRKQIHCRTVLSRVVVRTDAKRTTVFLLPFHGYKAFSDRSNRVLCRSEVTDWLSTLIDMESYYCEFAKQRVEFSLRNRKLSHKHTLAKQPRRNELHCLDCIFLWKVHTTQSNNVRATAQIAHSLAMDGMNKDFFRQNAC